MYDILNSNEYTEMEGRRYLNPQVSLDESNQFIDNLRSSQQVDNQKIQMDTYNLGTDISSNLGGLTSPAQNGNGEAGLSYFTSRYQVPQTASAVANLRTAAQAQALNQVLANEQAMWKKRYQDAYNAYQKRAWNKSNSGGGGGQQEEGDNPDFESTSSTVDVPSVPGKEGYYTIVDPASGDIIDVPIGSVGGTVRDSGRYISPLDAGYAIMGTPWMGAGTPGQHMYSTPTGGTIYVNLEDGYKIVYDTQDGKLVQVKE